MDFSQIENSILQVKKRDDRISHNHHSKIMSILPILSLIIISFVICNAYADNGSNNATDPKVTSSDPPRSEVMLVSATIISFTGFGSILAIRFQGSAIRGQVICSLIIYGAVLTEIILHLYVIMCSYDNTLLSTTYNQIIFVTMLMVAIIVVCFGIIAVLMKDYEEEKKNTDHKTDTAIDKSRSKFRESSTNSVRTYESCAVRNY